MNCNILKIITVELTCSKHLVMFGSHRNLPQLYFFSSTFFKYFSDFRFLKNFLSTLEIQVFFKGFKHLNKEILFPDRKCDVFCHYIQHDILSNLTLPGIWINKRHVKNVYIYSLLTHSKVDPSTFPRRVSHCYKDFHSSYLKFRKDLCIVLWDFALQWPSLIALKLSASQVYTSSRAQGLKVCFCKRTRRM